jgi:hypothetical protein
MNLLLVQVYKIPLISRLLGTMAGGVMGLVVLGWAVEDCGSRSTEVVVHVMEPDVEVTVGDQTYPIEGRRYDPIVCELSPGWHRLVMRRGDHVLF